MSTARRLRLLGHILASEASTGHPQAARELIELLVDWLNRGDSKLHPEVAHFLAEGLAAVLQGKAAKSAFHLGARRGVKQRYDPWAGYEQIERLRAAGATREKAFEQVSREHHITVREVERYYDEVAPVMNAALPPTRNSMRLLAG